MADRDEDTSGGVALIRPEWPAPERVHAAFSLRPGGVSRGRYAGLNLGDHVGDDAAAVTANRRLLCTSLQLPAAPAWLQQIHGIRVADLDQESNAVHAPADAAITRAPGRVAAVLVADCMPVLLTTVAGNAVAVAHAGWRGLAAGVLEAAVAAFKCEPRELIAWLGPAISAAHFEVGEEVRAAFLARAGEAHAAFSRNSRGRWQCDLSLLAHQRLAALGVSAVYGTVQCTYADAQRFYSHRRDDVTGRMAALIWMV